VNKPAEVKRGVRWLYYLLFLMIFMDYFDEIQGKVPFGNNSELMTAAFLYFLQFALYKSVSNGKNWARLIAVSINLLLLAFLALTLISTEFSTIRTTYSFGTILGLSGFIQTDVIAAGAYIFCFTSLLLLSTGPLLSSNAANWFKGIPEGVPLKEYSTQPKPSKKSNKKKKTTKTKSSTIINQNDEAAKEFVMETIRNLDYVVTRKILKKYIKSDVNARNLYAYLYGIALFTWSVRVTTMSYKDFEAIFEIVDNALNESGIKTPRHLDLDEDYDEISSGFDDIFSESIGMNSIQTDDDLIASVNQDFQSVGIYYARAYSKDDKKLSRIYFVKLVNNITENT
jgi:hypothetical protein